MRATALRLGLRENGILRDTAHSIVRLLFDSCPLGTVSMAVRLILAKLTITSSPHRFLIRRNGGCTRSRLLTGSRWLTVLQRCVWKSESLTYHSPS